MDELKLGVIGVGSVVREIYESLYYSSEYSDFTSVEAVAETNEERLNDFCDKHDIPASKRFTDYEKMIETCELDAVHVNTPDSLHEAPTVAALDAGLDVLLPKPFADSIGSAHRMRLAALRNDRMIGVDFHKRGNPQLIEARQRYGAGEYGEFQYGYWEMIDRLMVVDPNHEPPFFATSDFAEKNSPISFLTVHMADSFMQIVGLRPVTVRAKAWSQKLPSLSPKSVDGYDMCETEVVFENNGVVHFVSGWHFPNPAPAISNHIGRTICTDGVLEIMQTSGFWEITERGVENRNVLFQRTDSDGKVTGFGMSVPGDLLRKFAEQRAGELEESETKKLLDPMTLGVWSTAIVEAAHESLRRGETTENGVTFGPQLQISDLLEEQLGEDAVEYE
ncbi:MAG: Gfo/Idh/MocA family protein [Candidatus Brocadiia bacterium]